MTATHWEQLVAAAHQIDENVPYEWDDFDPIMATDVLKRNAAAIDTVAKLLKTRSAAPFRLEKQYYEEMWPQVLDLQRLVRVLFLRGKLALREKDAAIALDTGIQILDLAGDVRRDAILINGLAALPISGMGIHVLQKCRCRINDSQRRRLIAELVRQEGEVEPFDSILQRDCDWEIATGREPATTEKIPWDDPDVAVEVREFIEAELERLRRRPAHDRDLEKNLDLIVVAKRRLLIVDLALRNWQEAIGSYPSGLGSLAPHDLPTLPLDPFTNTEFIYRRQGDSFLLYSVGPKRYDAGGQFGSQSDVTSHRADLNLDGAESS